ncbi:MAG: hypothetical protein LAT53_11820 [Idiomarina sp.]|nr:hypothetical protein [Idiomarina sp.]
MLWMLLIVLVMLVILVIMGGKNAANIKNQIINNKYDPDAIELTVFDASIFAFFSKKRGSLLVSSSGFNNVVEIPVLRIEGISDVYDLTAEVDKESITTYCYNIDTQHPVFKLLKCSRKQKSDAIHDYTTIKRSLETRKSEITDFVDVNVTDITEILIAQGAKSRKKVVVFSLVTLVAVYFLKVYEPNKEERLLEEKQAALVKQQNKLEKTCSNTNSAPFQARHRVREALAVNPEFSNEVARVIGDCTFQIFGTVRGENAFGGTVINYYTLKLEGRIENDSVKWFTYQPIIDNDRDLVYRLYLSSTNN